MPEISHLTLVRGDRWFHLPSWSVLTLFLCFCRFTRYTITSLEKMHKPKLYVEPDLGIPLDLLDLSVYKYIILCCSLDCFRVFASLQQLIYFVLFFSLTALPKRGILLLQKTRSCYVMMSKWPHWRKMELREKSAPVIKVYLGLLRRSIFLLLAMMGPNRLFHMIYLWSSIASATEFSINWLKYVCICSPWLKNKQKNSVKWEKGVAFCKMLTIGLSHLTFVLKFVTHNHLL